MRKHDAVGEFKNLARRFGGGEEMSCRLCGSLAERLLTMTLNGEVAITVPLCLKCHNDFQAEIKAKGGSFREYRRPEDLPTWPKLPWDKDA